MKRIHKIFGQSDMRAMKSLLGKKIVALHHDESAFGNISIMKVGIFAENGVYALETSYEYLDFLWGEEGVASLHFVKTDEAGLIVSAKPPIKYVTPAVNDVLKEILIVRDAIVEFHGKETIGEFVYDKGIVLVFNGHQIALELERWSDEYLEIVRADDAVGKLDPLDKDWNPESWDEGYSAKTSRRLLALSEMGEE